MVLPVPWAPPISSSSPARRPPPIVLSSGVNPRGTGWYSPTRPPVTFSFRSTRTSIADRGARLPFGPSRRQAAFGVASDSVVTRTRPPDSDSRGPHPSTGPVTQTAPAGLPGRPKVPVGDAGSRQGDGAPGNRYRGRPASSSQSRTMTRVPSSKFSRSSHSLGAWALSPGWVNPSSTTGSPSTWSKAAVTGMDPPSRMYTGSTPWTASRARAAARVAGWSVGVRLGSPPWMKVVVTVTPGEATSAT